MSNWFKDRRQEFIHATLKQFGQIRRADIVREFGVTALSASNDIADFLAKEPPPYVRYDVSAKMYVLVEPDAPSVVGLNPQPGDTFTYQPIVGWMDSEGETHTIGEATEDFFWTQHMENGVFIFRVNGKRVLPIFGDPK